MSYQTRENTIIFVPYQSNTCNLKALDKLKPGEDRFINVRSVAD